ncbi:GAL4 domain-containing protein [Stagonosporopsis vannaccii]|nr:GAL4 domain-containing protein [Stagonosporopsis vannaccii]
MTRRSSGFVNKKPHRKSRGGCFTCKRKKVKCDERQPTCGYCSLRSLGCEYNPESISASPTSTAALSGSSSPASQAFGEEADFGNISRPIPSWLIPATQAASGPLYGADFGLLHHYKTFTWRTLTIRDDEVMVSLHRDSIPHLSLSHSYLLYALLSIAASHSNTLAPSKQAEQLALTYRQRTFAEYNKVLQNITAQNYESVLVTGMLLLSLVTPPDPEIADNDAYLVWMDTFLKMSEGLRILASLRWAAGIEKLSIYPLICRELRALPPSPIFHPSVDRHLHTRVGAVGTTPDYPNPPSTYHLKYPEALPVFLPPPLMSLLASLSNAESASGPFDLHANTLYPVLHAFSPIFLSLYYYHLNPDFFVRVFVFCSFLMPEFLLLVKTREPRALALVAWWFALAGLAPRGWWIGKAVERVVKAVGENVQSKGDAVTRGAFESVDRIVRVLHTEGREAAAQSVFEGWKDVHWNDGPEKAEEWEASLLTEWTVDPDFDTGILTR